MHFSNPRAHGVPLFVSAKILPLNLLYFETVRISCMISQKNSAPENNCNNFIRCSSIHSHNTRASTPENFYINCIRARTNWVLLQFVEQKYEIALHLEYTQTSKNFFSSSSSTNCLYHKVYIISFSYNHICLFIVLFAKNCTNQIKSNYLNSHGEEAQEKPPGL